MALRFDIITNDPVSMEEFKHIRDAFATECEDLSGMIKYIIHRFDPGSTEVRAAASIDAKSSMAERLSGWKVPEKNIIIKDEKGIHVNPSPEWEKYCMVEAEVLMMYPHKWVFLESLLISMYNAMSVMRMPLPLDMGAEDLGKLQVTIGKAAEQANKCLDIFDERMREVADMDEDAAARLASSMSRKRKRRDLTGRTEDE